MENKNSKYLDLSESGTVVLDPRWKIDCVWKDLKRVSCWEYVSI